MKRLARFGLAVPLLAAAAGSGIRPRGSSADYPAHETAGEVTVGAAIVPPEQVHKLFATDLNGGGYIVVEVAVYPEAGREVNVASGDFMLQIGPDAETVRAVSAAAIASVLQRKNLPPPPKPGGVTVTPTATVGYESGGYDPLTGRRTHGVYTGAGVGVGVGEAGGPQVPGPASTDRDRSTMQQELADKALPEGKTASAVAGYLFFPKPAGKVKSPSAELTYYGASRQLKLRVPVTRKP